MTVLVIQIPPRQRLRARGPGIAAPDSDTGTAYYAYALSPDGFGLMSQGKQCPASLLPKADTVVAVLSDADVGWHRITLPKSPAARLGAALVGVLEEALLEDADSTLLAVAPQAAAGQPTWIAAVNLPWLRSELAELERAQIFVDRVVPGVCPDEVPSGHFVETEEVTGTPAEGISLSWSHAGGAALLNLQGGLTRELVPGTGLPGTRWTATPSAAEHAEHWLGAPVNVMPTPFRLLQASRTLWNLRQFSLARKHKGVRAARDFFRELMSPDWRPARYGLVTLLLLQVLGLNLWAWHQRSAMEAKNTAMVKVLQTTFPQIRAVLDARLQMQREVQALRALAGKPGDSDLEPLLQATAMAWPTDRPPVDNLQFKEGQLSLAATGWSDEQIEQFRSQLNAAGWHLESAEGRLIISRTSNDAGQPPGDRL
jgi:general secretion pathway protein L